MEKNILIQIKCCFFNFPQGFHVELPMKSTIYKGQRSFYRINLLYTSAAPLILHSSFVSTFNLFSQVYLVLEIKFQISRDFFVHLMLDYFDKIIVWFTLNVLLGIMYNTCKKLIKNFHGKRLRYINICITGSVNKIQRTLLFQLARSLGCKYICWTLWREQFCIFLIHSL